jgi:hypothetical protein
MHAGEEPSADQHIHPRRGVAAGDVDPFAGDAVVVPFDGEAMGGVFGRETGVHGQKPGADVREANHADSADGHSADDFGTERRGEHPRDSFRFDPKVDQDPSIDSAFDNRKHRSGHSATRFEFSRLGTEIAPTSIMSAPGEPRQYNRCAPSGLTAQTASLSHRAEEILATD